MTQTASSPPAAPTRITYEQFLEHSDEDVLAEWVDGEVIEMTVDERHDDIGGFLYALLRYYSDEHGSGRLFQEPFQMKTAPDLPGRSPDIFFLSAANMGRLRRKHVEGPADLVIEIIGPESVERDRGTKYVEYERGGVGEYWIVDPIHKRAEFHVRGTDDLFHEVAADSEGWYQSVILAGLRVNVNWLWQEPLPPLRAVLTEVGAI